jgi:predicted DNA binding CopG/RHH family protein
MPVGKLTPVYDFLPPPEKLAIPDENVKITISLKRSSVHYFKLQAQKHRTKYQKMIRALLDYYASHHPL